jgi:hypothetical protein
VTAHGDPLLPDKDTVRGDGRHGLLASRPTRRRSAT